MLKLPVTNIKSITSKGIVIDVALPDSEDMLKFLGALLIYEENKVTNLYVIDLYKFINVSISQIGFHQMCWITYFETELIILEDHDKTIEHVIYIGKLLSKCNHIPLGSKTWGSEDSQFDYEMYINTLGMCYELYRTLDEVYCIQNNDLVINLVTLFNDNYKTDLLTKPLGSTLIKLNNVIKLLEDNYLNFVLT